MDFGGSTEGGFNKATINYKENPSLKNYLRLRRANPKTEIEISIHGGIDPLFHLVDELESFGFDPLIVAGTLDADPDAINHLCLQIIEKIVEAEKLKNKGETHLVRRKLAVPDKLIDWLICSMLDSLSWNNNLDIPRDLIVLVRSRLIGGESHYHKQMKANGNRQNAKWIGAQMIAQGEKPTIRQIAKILEVAPSTVLRWFPDKSFVEEATRLSQRFDKNGNLKPISDLFRSK